MGSTEYLECPLCGDNHPVDEYDFVNSCIGYFWVEEFKIKVIEYFGKKK